MTRVLIWVRPAAANDHVAWNPWRRRWVVSCRAAPYDGAANREVLRLLQRWLDVPVASIRWFRAGASRRKEVEVDHLDADEIERRLRRVAESAIGGSVGASDANG